MSERKKMGRAVHIHAAQRPQAPMTLSTIEAPCNLLTLTEQQTLESCEADILRSGESIVGSLRTIRDQRLHRETHSTFEEYCREKWGLTDRHVRRLMDHADVLGNVAEMTTGPNGSTQIRERATREIADLSPDDQRTVVAEVLSTGEKPTAKAVRKARAKAGLARSTNGEPAKLLPAPADDSTDAPLPSGEVRAATVMAIRNAGKAAESWTDPEAVADVVNEMQKWIKRLSPPAVNSPPPKQSAKFIAPTVDEVRAYLVEKGYENLVDPEAFVGHYESVGWKSGKSKMISWHGKVATWVKTARDDAKAKAPKSRKLDDYDDEVVIRKAANRR